MIDMPIEWVQFHIIKVDITFLLCLANMDWLEIYFNNVKNILVTKNQVVLVIWQFNHSFLLWKTAL